MSTHGNDETHRLNKGHISLVSNQAERHAEESSNLTQITWKDAVKTVIATIVISLFLHVFCVSFFRVPTNSMSPTILPGDYVIVNKCAYYFGLPEYIPYLTTSFPHAFRWNYNTPQRGDIIVFNFPYKKEYPQAPSIFVKRIIGIPGDTLYVGDSTIYYGLDALTHYQTPPKLQPFKVPIILPFRGKSIHLDNESIQYWKRLIEYEGNVVDVVNNIVLINNNSTSHYEVAHNYYYVLGDNRQDSFDSRYWGIISEREIIGSPAMIYWSKTMSDSNSEEIVRTERIGTRIR